MKNEDIKTNEDLAVWIRQQLPPQINLNKKILEFAHDNLKIESARIDVVLLSTSTAALWFAFKSINYTDLLVTSISLFSIEIILNVLFLILSQHYHNEERNTATLNLNDLEHSLANEFEDLEKTLEEIDARTNKLIRNKFSECVMKYNLFLQFLIWMLALVFLVLHHVI